MVSRLEGGDGGSNGVDDAGRFVAHDDRLLGGYKAFDSAMEPEMDLALVVRFRFVLVREREVCDAHRFHRHLCMRCE
jgi:hypothetical protein